MRPPRGAPLVVRDALFPSKFGARETGFFQGRCGVSEILRKGNSSVKVRRLNQCFSRGVYKPSDTANDKNPHQRYSWDGSMYIAGLPKIGCETGSLISPGDPYKQRVLAFQNFEVPAPIPAKKFVSRIFIEEHGHLLMI